MSPPEVVAVAQHMMLTGVKMDTRLGMTNGELAAMWLWAQVGDRLAGLMQFGDIIAKWRVDEESRLDQVVAEHFERNPEISFLVDPVDEARWALVYTRRAMAASLVTALTALVENLIVGLCAFAEAPLRKPKPHWDDAVKSLRNHKQLDVEQCDGYWAVKRARLLSNCFKHSDGVANAELSELAGLPEGEDVEYEAEDLPALLHVVDSFFAALRNRVTTLED